MTLTPWIWYTISVVIYTYPILCHVLTLYIWCIHCYFMTYVIWYLLQLMSIHTMVIDPTAWADELPYLVVAKPWPCICDVILEHPLSVSVLLSNVFSMSNPFECYTLICQTLWHYSVIHTNVLHHALHRLILYDN